MAKIVKVTSHFPTNRKAREYVIEAWNRRAELKAIIPWGEDNEHV